MKKAAKAAAKATKQKGKKGAAAPLAAPGKTAMQKGKPLLRASVRTQIAAMKKAAKAAAKATKQKGKKGAAAPLAAPAKTAMQKGKPHASLEATMADFQGRLARLEANVADTREVASSVAGLQGRLTNLYEALEVTTLERRVTTLERRVAILEKEQAWLQLPEKMK